MPVDFKCDNCDKALRVRDELAGKRIKCPGCSTAITVPAEEAPAPKRSSATRAEKPAPPPPPKRRPADDEEDEKPQRASRKSRDEDEDEDEDEAPKRSAAVRDTKPSARHKVDEEEEDEKPRRASRKGRDEEDEDDEDRFKKKDKKKAGSSLPLILGIGGGSVGLVLIGLAVWWFFFTGSKPGGGGGDGKGGPGGGSKVSDITGLKPWVPGNAQGFVTVRLADVLETPQAKMSIEEAKKRPGGPQGDPMAEIEKNLGINPTNVERITFVSQDAQKQLAWAVIELSAPLEEAKFKAAFNQPSELTHEGKKYLKGMLGKDPRPGEKSVVDCAHYASDKLIVVGQEPGLRQAITLAANRQAGALDDGLALLAGGKHFVGAGIVPQDQVNGFKFILGGNPQVRPFLPLLEAQSGTATLHLSEKELEIEVSVKFPDDAKAQAAKNAVDQGITFVKQKLTGAAGGGDVPKEFKELVEKAANNIKVSQEGPKVVIKGQVDASPDTWKKLMPLIAQADGPANSRSSNNMKQLLLAMHNYHDATGRLPTDILEPGTKKPLLSWRVAILPYLGPKEAALYRRFKLNEAWDSANNRPLLKEMPTTFARSGVGPGYSQTRYVVFTGPGTAFPTADAIVKLTSFTDGTANTVIMGEAFQEVQWSQPGDFAIMPGQAIKFRLYRDGRGYLLGFADGTARTINALMRDDDLRKALTPGGGEVLPPIFTGR
jgi:hypothetical protein